jgi:MraZ protein
MFTGSYFNTIDSKGRVVIPNKLRFELGERIWLTQSVDGCLSIYTQDGWREYTRIYISNLSLIDENARKLARFVLGGARELEIDRLGRINLPQDQIEHAGIEKDVVFVGIGDSIEVWGAEALERKTDPKGLNLIEIMHDAEETAVWE